MKHTQFRSKLFEGFEVSAKERRAINDRKHIAKARIGIGEIGLIGECENPKRREACRLDFKHFVLTYFLDEFELDFSDDHLKVIEKIERAVLKGELYAVAMPRGSGKTTLSEKAVVWCTLYGHRLFPIIIGSDKGAATRNLDTIKRDLETNDFLFADFPEICTPIRKLEGLAQRAHSQTYQGVQTRITWTTDTIVIPTIEGSKSSGIIVKAYGLTGGIRGAKFSTADGGNRRPDFAMIDDPQTDASAHSQSQNDTRERLMKGAVLKLAGPGVKMAGVMPCTVIASEDMADRILDRKKNPRWQGDRMKMIYRFPDDLELWNKFKEAWQDGLRDEDGGDAGREFYTDNRGKLDDGCEIAWKARIEDGDISAIHSAMSFFLEDEAGFMAEYQNEPINPFDDPENQLHEDDLVQRCNNIRRGVVPADYGRLVAFADVGTETGINWVVMALGKNFAGSVVDYGTTKVKHGKGTDAKAEVTDGLMRTIEQINRPYQFDGGGSDVFLTHIGIDAGWQSETIYKFCREHKNNNILIPVMGAYVKPGHKLYSAKAKGAIKGTQWIYATVQHAARPVRLLRANSNHWKTFTFERFRRPLGGDGALTFFGQKSSHKTYFQHMTSEYKTVVEVEGVKFDRWDIKPNRQNHLFDATYGCCVLGNFMGIDTDGAAITNKVRGRTRKRITAKGVVNA